MIFPRIGCTRNVGETNTKPHIHQISSEAQVFPLRLWFQRHVLTEFGGTYNLEGWGSLDSQRGTFITAIHRTSWKGWEIHPELALGPSGQTKMTNTQKSDLYWLMTEILHHLWCAKGLCITACLAFQHVRQMLSINIIYCPRTFLNLQTHSTKKTTFPPSSARPRTSIAWFPQSDGQRVALSQHSPGAGKISINEPFDYILSIFESSAILKET